MPETLAQKVRAKFPGAYDDLSDQELEAKVLTKFPGVYDDLPRTAQQAPTADSSSWTDTAVNLLPSAGGLVGGVVGGIGGTAFGVGVGGVPGAVGGAALGGAAGEAAKELVNRLRGEPVPATPQAAMHAIGGEAAMQGGLELAGGALGKATAGVGRAMIENAVRPTQTVLRSFPDVMQTIVKYRLPVGKGLFNRMAGSAQAAQKLGQAAGVTRELLAKAAESGQTFSPLEVAKPVVDLVDDIVKQPLGEAEQTAIHGMLTEFFKRHPGPLTPQAVKDLKQAAQAIAKPIYKAIEQGMPVTADQAIKARFSSAIAKGGKETLERIPGVRASEAETQALIGAKRALTQAEGRRLSLMAEGVTGAAGIVASLLGSSSSNLPDSVKRGATAYLVMRGFMSPRSQSRAGLALTAQATRDVLRQFPRLAEAVLIEAQGSGR